MIEIKLEGEKCDIKTKGNFTALFTELTKGIPEVMKQFLIEHNIKTEYCAGYVRYLIDALEEKFL